MRIVPRFPKIPQLEPQAQIQKFLRPFMGSLLRFGPMAINMRDKCFKTKCMAEVFLLHPKAMFTRVNLDMGNQMA